MSFQLEGFNVIRIFPCAFHNVENGQRGTNDREIFFINLFLFLFIIIFLGSCNWFLHGFLFFIYLCVVE